MADSEHLLLLETLERFRRHEVEPVWDQLDCPDAALYGRLFARLRELGFTSLGVGTDDDLELDAISECEVFACLAAGCPALALGLLSHLSAAALVGQADPLRLSSFWGHSASGMSAALVGSPLDHVPSTELLLQRNGRASLRGVARLHGAAADLLVVPAVSGGQVVGCVLERRSPRITVRQTASAHGLCLLPIIELQLDGVSVPAHDIFMWPVDGLAANRADARVTAVLAGMLREMAARAAAYAVDRYQGGKMISEHDAVRQLVGPILMAQRAAMDLAVAQIRRAAAADGARAAFIMEIARQCALDAVQTLGGAGYMEDYRLERYLRDVNTIETSLVHHQRRTREVARDYFSQLTR